MAHLSVRLLGPFEAEADGQRLSGFRSNKVRALLAHLCVESHRSWPRSTIAGLLWPDFPERYAQSNLRNALSNLRKVIGDQTAEPPYLHITETNIQFNQSSDCTVDMILFSDLLAKADSKKGVPLDTPEIEKLEEAIALYQGEFLEGFSVDSASFEEWMLATREQIRGRLMRALRQLALGYERMGDLEAAFERTRRYLELEPWDEAAYRYQMKILASRNQRNAALALYDECCAILARELGIQPEPETVQLYQQIRDRPAEQVTGGKSQTWEWDAGLSLPRRHLPEFLIEGKGDETLAPAFFARQKEISILNTVLERAIQGQGSVYFITGEPGSGKTTLMAEFARQAMQEYPEVLVSWGQGNAFSGQGDPYFPFLNILRMLAGEIEIPLSAGAITAWHARRLWNCLPETIEGLLDYGPDLFNHFLSGNDLFALASLHREVKNVQLKRLHELVKRMAEQPPQVRLLQSVLCDQYTQSLGSLAQNHPLILMVDDLQWIDPGSVNLLFHLGHQIASRKILVLGAYRPEEVMLSQSTEVHPLQEVIHEMKAAYGDNQIDLMQSEGKSFVKELIDSEPNELGQGFRDRLYQHTSGNALFTIELLRGMQLRGEILKNNKGNWVEEKQLNWESLPSRVEAVIARRVSHLSKECQELLNIACVEGEEFTAEVLATVLGMDEQRVCDLLSREAGKHYRLVSAQSRQKIGELSLSLYRFRHSLFQIYLYNHLDVIEKVRWHGKIATALENIYLTEKVKLAEIAHSLARHFEVAEMGEKAVQYYTLAGKYAMQLSANQEAVSHFQRALQINQSLPESEKRDWQALDLYLSLGPTITVLYGWGAPELELNYQQAELLCYKLGDDTRLVPALWLLAVYRLGRAEYVKVDRLVVRISNLAQKIGDPELQSLADLQVGPLYQGRLNEARELLRRASQQRDVDLQRSIAYRYGLSPAVVGLAYLSHCLWLLGYPDQAAACTKEAINLAKKVNVPMTSCYSLGRACWHHSFNGELEDTQKYAEELLHITQRHGFRNYELGAVFFIHWVNIQSGKRGEDVLEKMFQAMEEYHSLGTVMNRTTFLILFAQACEVVGQIARGLAAIEESISLAEKTGERWFEAEAYRVKGELNLLQAKQVGQTMGDSQSPERCFSTSIEIARQQGAKMLELRSVMSLCKLWQSQGRGKEGIQMLSGIVNQFTEGLETNDLRQANAMLGELDQLP